METREVFAIISLFVVLSGTVLGLVTAGIGYTYRTEIKRAEADYARRLGSPKAKTAACAVPGSYGQPVERKIYLEEEVKVGSRRK